MGGACRSNLDRYIGSSKDQTADLLWRMRRAESRLAANEEFGARERQRKNKYSRAELERIIERFEKRRASWTHVKDEYQVFQTSNLDRFYPGKSEGHFSDVRFALDQFHMRTDALKAKLDLDDKRSKRSDSPLFPRHTQPSPSREPEARVFQEERMSPRYTAHVQFEGPNIESQMASAAAVASVALRRGSEEASIFVEAGDQAPVGEDQVLSAELGTDSDTIEEESDLLQALRAFKLKTEDLKNDILLSEGQDGPV
ncbi:hypothetical protein BSKO_06984 [Bryopsis sp. KO-2023]|nr:hypothetical protein BSKO_06984 [Bryopsis sp. KO-2023]